MIELEFAPRFVREVRQLARHPEFVREDLEQLLEDMTLSEVLPKVYRDHPLGKRGVNLAGFMECHLSPDIVVVYKRRPGLVRLYRIGGHAEVLSKP